MINQRLQLDWIGKNVRPRLEPRILLEDEKYSYTADYKRAADQFDNILIRGDNLLALKALESSFAGTVKCAIIDPPYNTGSAFDHYDDGVEHSVWLSLIRERLEIIRSLLRYDGSIWITIDDNEAHYLKVLCDEIFGRHNFISTVVWQKKYAVKSDSEFFSSSHDYILVYAKDVSKFKLGRFPRSATQDARYKNPDNDSRGAWTSGPLQRNEARDYAIFPILSSSGREHWPPKGTSWRFTKERIDELRADNRIWFGESGNNVPRLKRFLTEVSDSVPATTWWDYSNFGHNDEAKREAKTLAGDENVFSTPKPERLVKSILQLATAEGDLVMDSFAGSGTTGAVAHKMRRRWIMVELGDHCETHIVTRLQKVIKGIDEGGVTKEVGWEGGGGYRYFRLAPSLLEKDQFGNLVISKSYNAEMLSEAMCKHFCFTYDPSPELYWMHGYSSETDFIYVTTASLTHDQLRSISQQVGDSRTLLICCKAFQSPNPESFENLTIRKIPAAVLNRCDWGKDDYSLKIENLPMMGESNDENDASDEDDPEVAAQGGLFHEATK
jgi:adenine-specific DNA-methyltransferase